MVGRKKGSGAMEPMKKFDNSSDHHSLISPMQVVCMIFGMVFIAGLAAILLSIQGVIDAKTRARRQENKENVSVLPEISSNWCDFRSEGNSSDGTQLYDIYREHIGFLEQDPYDVVYNLSMTFDSTRRNVSDFVSIVGIIDSFSFVVGYAVDLQRMFFLNLGFIPRQGIVQRIQRHLIGRPERIQWHSFRSPDPVLKLNFLMRGVEIDFSVCDDRRCVNGFGIDSHLDVLGHNEHKLIIVDILSRTNGASLRCDVASKDEEQMCWLARSDGAVVPVLCKEVEDGLLGSVLSEYIYEKRG